MLRKFATKFVHDILPSVIATVLGAYIVTHYINAKPSDSPAAASASARETKASEPKPGEAAAAATQSDAGSEKVADKPVEKAEKPDKPAGDKPVAERRPHQPNGREKLAKPASPAAVAVAAPTPPAAEERRDAAELARAALARQRTGSESGHAAEPARTGSLRTAETPAETAARHPEALPAQEPMRAPIAPPALASAVPTPPVLPSLPPPVTVAPASAPTIAPAPAADAQRDGLRPTPPAEIPAAVAEEPQRRRGSVTEEVLTAAKSVFQAVIPR